jgi:predicted PurR-regulated permease PerM
VGPIVSVIPAVLVGLADGGLLQAVHVTVVYGAVQFLEGNFITPIIQKYAVALPPAVLLMAQFLMGILVGLFGVLLATPLAVAVIVLIQMLYVEDVLGDSVEVLGEQQ